MNLSREIKALRVTSVAEDVIFDASYFDWSLTQSKDSNVGLMYIIEVNSRFNIFCFGQEPMLLAWVRNEFQSEINRISY